MSGNQLTGTLFMNRPFDDDDNKLPNVLFFTLYDCGFFSCREEFCL
jgi:hypothetical protein